MDFRKADPSYVNFVPKTCVEAIDLFRRHRTLGMATELCAKQLPDKELDMFHRSSARTGTSKRGARSRP